jgi:hypothetical protein
MAERHLFLDANVYLSFYKLSDNDVAELQNLVTAVKTGEITLHLTEQARDEFQRNRDSAIAESLKAIGNQRLAPSFPRMFVNHAGYEELDQSVKAYEEQRKKMLAEVTEAAANNELSADKLIKELFELAHVIPLTDEIWERAKRRYDLRNPPGKGQSYGDAVHWESLLSEVPDGQNLLVVTDDADFKSKLDRARVADFLRDEWGRKKGSDVTVYANLSSMFRDHFPDTKLLVEAEQEMAARALAVKSLTGSENFLQTHAAVQLALQHADFTRNEVEELFRAAVQNTQIRWIIEDDDVFRFFTQLAHQYSDVVDPALLSEFWALFEHDSTWD